MEYTYKLAIRDTGVYGIANGSFENGLDGWTLVGTVGESPFGGVDNKTTFWGEGYAMNNIGSYFSSYADGAEEASQGTLASPYFTVKSEYATYMLGGAGNRNVYITIENKNGDVLAIYRNTKFADFPEGEFSVEQKREMIGSTVFLANLVTYKVNLSAFNGQEIRFVIHDHASSGWGVVFFDELITYYSSEEEITENAVLAENLLANKDELNAEIALGITEKGDYTEESYNAYAEKLEEAKSIVSNINVDQDAVDKIAKELKDARLALTVRPIEEVKDTTKVFKLTAGNIKEIVLADYINTNGLSKISYEIKSNNSAVTLGSLVDGKLTVTAGEVSKETDVTVSINALYDGNIKLTVTLSIKVTNDQTPTVLVNEIVKEYDVYALENKANIILDLSKNIDNAANIKLSYSVNYNGKDTALSDSLYTFTFGKYTEAVTDEIITVTVSYELNGQPKTSEYTYKLSMKDTTSYRLVNGGFENGLTGWDKVGNIGDVSSDTSYWVNEWENDGKGYLFGMDGEKMFSAYAPGAEESAVGTLTSSTFTIGGSGFITFKLGAMKDGNYVYVDVVDAKTKEILARYYNGLWAEYTDELKSGCTLISYKADLSAFIGKDVFFRVSDNADSGYGLFFLDSFNTYYETEPDGFNVATSVNYNVTGTIYDLFNGGFELGDVQGWWNNGEIGHVTDADAFFSGVAYGKDGNYLYSGVEDFEAGNGKEGNRGVLTSSMFEIGGTGHISFMLGGGGNVLCYIQVIDSTTGEILAR
ncbi:MAG: FIVAR domain-containing protein, partial [Clostridia bacterium]|nr:FIVAR domain-containing protein [Clostridia bacterium]